MFQTFREKFVRYTHQTYQSKDIFLLAFFILCLNLCVNIFNRYFLGLGYPYSTFLFMPDDRFADFFKVIDAFHIVSTWGDGNPYDAAESIYKFYAMPFGTVYYYFFAKLILLSNNKNLVYVLLNVTLLGTHFFLSRKAGNSYLVILLSIVTYPVIFAIDRGNLALAVYLLVFLALTFDGILISSLTIAIATCLKITPAIFILPAVLHRPLTVKRISISLSLLGLFTTLIIYFSISLIRGNLTNAAFDFSEFNEMAAFYNAWFISNLQGLPYGSSLYMATYYFAKRFHFNFFIANIKPLALPLFIYGLAGVSLLLKHRNFKLILNKYLTFEKLIFIICTSFVLFTPVTADYYLLFMLLPLLLFPKMVYSFEYFVVYGTLLGAKNFLFLSDTNISYQVFLNPLLLLLMLLAEFELIGFIKRSNSGDGDLKGDSLFLIIRNYTMRQRKITYAVLILVAIVISINFYLSKNEKVRTRNYAEQFKNKDWYYSVDDGKQWSNHAEGGLKNFDEDGNPMHVSPVWGEGEWIDENTIIWRASTGSEAIWKHFEPEEDTSISAKQIARSKTFAEAFAKKKWFYSIDGGKNFIDRADGALKNFDKYGNPVHVDPIWGIGLWKDENTILWTASTGSEAIWKSDAKSKTPEHSAEEIVLWKGFADSFKNKEWFYSADGGITWAGRAEGALNGFDGNGNPIHVDLVWGVGTWVDANTITWTATTGSESIWKALGGATSVLSPEEIIKAKKFAEAFKTKKWYYSIDGGAHWEDRAEGGLKAFDENGSPVHDSSVWGIGQWKDENTIYWRASNGSESLWKAFDTPPVQ